MFELVAATACSPPIICERLIYDTSPASASRPSAVPVPMLSFCTGVKAIDPVPLEGKRSEQGEPPHIHAQRPWFGPRNKVLRVAPFGRSGGIRSLARLPIELRRDQARRRIPRPCRMVVA